jgi:hypothetical protein
MSMLFSTGLLHAGAYTTTTTSPLSWYRNLYGAYHQRQNILRLLCESDGINGIEPEQLPSTFELRVAWFFGLLRPRM